MEKWVNMLIPLDFLRHPSLTNPWQDLPEHHAMVPGALPWCRGRCGQCSASAADVLILSGKTKITMENHMFFSMGKHSTIEDVPEGIKISCNFPLDSDNYGKSPLWMRRLTISMPVFNGYFDKTRNSWYLLISTCNNGYVIRKSWNIVGMQYLHSISCSYLSVIMEKEWGRMEYNQ